MLGFMFSPPPTHSMIWTHKPEKPFPHYNRKQTRTDIMFLLINSQLLPISLPSTVAASGHYPPKSQHLATYTYYTILGASGSLLGLCLCLGAPSTPFGLLPIASLPHQRQTLHKVSLSRLVNLAKSYPKGKLNWVYWQTNSVFTKHPKKGMLKCVCEPSIGKQRQEDYKFQSSLL